MNRRLESILDELHSEDKITYINNLKMPIGFDSGIRLKHMLQNQVEDKYYLSEELQRRFVKSLDDSILQNKIPHGDNYKVIGTTQNIEAKGTNSRHWVYDSNYNMSCLSATDYKQPKQILAETHRTNCIGQVSQNEKSQAGKVYDTEGVSQTLCAGTHGYAMGNIVEPKIVASRGRYNSDGKVEQNYEVNNTGNTNTLTSVQKDNYVLENKSNFRIRKLTPLECWRLMGFDDEDFYNAKNLGLSDSALYKLAGNSIVVNCLYYIFKNVFKEFEI